MTVQSKKVSIVYKSGRSQDKLKIIFNKDKTLKGIRQIDKMKYNESYSTEQHVNLTENSMSRSCHKNIDQQTLLKEYVYIKQNLETKSREFEDLYMHYQNLKKKIPVSIFTKPNVNNSTENPTRQRDTVIAEVKYEHFNSVPLYGGHLSENKVSQAVDSNSNTMKYLTSSNAINRMDTNERIPKNRRTFESSDENVITTKSYGSDNDKHEVIFESQERMTKEKVAALIQKRSKKLIELFTNLGTIEETGESQTSLVSLSFREIRSQHLGGYGDIKSLSTLSNG